MLAHRWAGRGCGAVTGPLTSCSSIRAIHGKMSAARGGWRHTSAHDEQGSWPVPGPGHQALAVNGDEVRALRFRSGKFEAYLEVDELLRHVAAELDAGRPVGPLIKNAKFRRLSGGFARAHGYDVDAVDWFLDQLLLRPDHSGPAGIGTDPWHDLDMAQLARSEVSGPAAHPVGLAWLASEKQFAEECANAWRDFGQAPGTCLWWGWAARWSWELRTPEAHTTIASLRNYRYRPGTFSTGGRSFTFQKIRPARSSPPGVDEIAARSDRDYDGHFAKNRQLWADRIGISTKRLARRLVDETGTPILYTSGRNFNHRACACISFPDQRWLRFLVRGTQKDNAIMTAVDPAGNAAVRYRIISRPRAWDTVEITVHPNWTLTEELALAIAISAPWLGAYFELGGGG